MLLEQTRLDILNRIKTYKTLLSAKVVTSTTEALAKFENSLFLNELEACLSSTPPTEHLDKLRILFAKRWEKIRNSTMDYTQNPFNEINRFCLDIAKTMAPLITDGSCLGPYFILMPSLKVAEDIYGNNIHDFALHQFVLGDGERVFIPIEGCVDRISISDTGELQHLVSEDGRYRTLSPTEKKRLTTHSTVVSKYLAVLEEHNIYRIHGQTFEARLHRLHNALLRGGARAQGQEYDSGSVANIAIAEFYEYWETFSPAEKSQLHLSYPKLQEVIGRLFRPADKNYRQVSFCVEKIADVIEEITILTKKTILEKIKIQKKGFLKIRERAFDCLPSQAKLPNIWEELCQLPLSAQAIIFAHSPHKDAWLYALEFALEDIPVFKPFLNAAAKSAAVTKRFEKNRTPLMLAAIAGYEASINLLLEIGVSVDALDADKNTALMVAAEHGNLKIVKILLDARAGVDAANNKGNTALHEAIIGGHRPIVEALLAKGADIKIRNDKRQNALDLASQYHPELLELLLPKAFNLKSTDQIECLKGFGSGIYKNMLTFARVEYPQFLNKLYEVFPKESCCQVIAFLDRMEFDKHFCCINAKYNRLRKQAEGNPYYREAAATAKNLVISLAEEATLLFSGTSGMDIRKAMFKANCTSHIHSAKEVLSTHRGWKGVLATLLLVLAFPISVPLLAAGFFSTKTDSMHKLLDFETALNRRI